MLSRRCLLRKDFSYFKTMLNKICWELKTFDAWWWNWNFTNLCLCFLAYGSCRAVLVDTALQTSHRILGWCLYTGRLGWRFLSLGLGTRRCTPVTVTAVTLLSLPGKVNAMALERRACLLVKPRIQEEQWRFHPGCRTLYKLFKLLNIFGGRWEFAQWVYVFFADLEKAFSCIPWSALWGPSGP